MKKLIVIFILLSISIFTFAEEVLVFGCENEENFPYIMGKSEKTLATNPGSVIEFLKLVGDELGVKIVFKRMPWKRGLVSLHKGQIDGLFNASFKKDRLEIGAYPMKDGKVDPARQIMTRNYVIYKRKGDKLDWNGESFLNLNGKIGAPRGYSVIGDLEKVGVIVEESPGTLNDLKKLAMGRLQGAAALELAADQILYNNKELASKIEKVKMPFIAKPYYIMLSHQLVERDPVLAEKIWGKIGELRDEKMEDLNQKYY